MNVRLTVQITILTPPTAVFEYLVEPKYHTLWNPQLQQITPLQRLKTGATYHTTSFLLGVTIAGTNEVSKCSEPSQLILNNSTGLLHYRVHYKLKANAGSTLLRCTIDVSADKQAFAFAKPVLKLLARRELQSDLQALKIAVEQQLNPL